MRIDGFDFESKGTFIVAELSANHRQKFDVAVETVKAAKSAGANAIKLQTYTAETLTIDCDNEFFKISGKTIWDGKTYYDLYKEAFTPWDWHPKLKTLANDLGLTCFSSPFDNTAVDFLEQIGMPAYKIASFEIVDLPLIEYVASKGKPIIISTGIASLEEITEAVDVCKLAGNSQIALLKCTSQYPAPVKSANLGDIPRLASLYNVMVGLSDHTMGITVPTAAVTMGARIIEKHLILDRGLGGPDSSFSLEPQEFSEMVRAVRETEMAINTSNFELTDDVKRSRIFARSLFVVEDVLRGEYFTARNVKSIRPSYGLAPKYLNKIIGTKARGDISRGTPLKWDMIDE